MALVEVTDEFRSQMNFLKMYDADRSKKKEELGRIKSAMTDLQPYVDEYEELKKNEAELKKEIRDDEKFLISMNDMVRRVTGEPISNGPLFDKDEGGDNGKAENE